MGYIVIMVALVNFLGDNAITSIYTIPYSIWLKSEGVNLGIIIIYTLCMVYTVVKEKKDHQA